MRPGGRLCIELPAALTSDTTLLDMLLLLQNIPSFAVTKMVRSCHRKAGAGKGVVMTNNKYFWILVGFILIMQIPIFLMMK